MYSNAIGRKHELQKLRLDEEEIIEKEMYKFDRENMTRKWERKRLVV